MQADVSPAASPSLPLAKTGATWIAAAVLLNIFPRFGGPGWIWSLALLGASAWLWFGRPQSWHLIVWSLVASAHALNNFYIGLGALFWLVGAVFSIRAVWPMFNWSRAKRGYAPYAVFGALLCLWTPFWTWGQVSAWSGSQWMGGFDLNTRVAPGGGSYTSMDYTATRWLMPLYSPGWDYSGRALSGSFNASLVVLALLGWALWRDEASRHRTRLLPLAGAILLLGWVFPALSAGYNGPRVFLVGVLGLGFCALMALRGKQNGAFDAGDVAEKVKREIGKGTVSR